MAIDPQVSELVKQMREADGKAIEEMSVAEARMSGWDFIPLQGEPEPVAKVAHRFVTSPTADLPVRIYYPEGTGPFPALVYFHGSGWVVNNIEICDSAARTLANGTGCVVVAVNYQKAPERKFPIAVDDAWAATKWVATHAQELDIDRARIGVIGDSAGGNLAAVTAIRARDEGGPALACQVLIYPVTDADVDRPSYLSNAEGYMLQRTSMKWFFGHYLNNPAEGDDPRVSPLRATDLSRLPPALVITAEYDPLRDEGYLYAEKLKAAGTPTTYKEYAGAIHGIFWMKGVLDVSKTLHADVAAWVRDRMQGR